MSFLYPLGLLGLIGIPVLIIIYIIKSKYTEQTVSSTYLWTLSEKFLKRKNPISRLTGLISLILQLLAVTVISLAIAHPIITVPNSANEYCFILDGSGSMHMDAGVAENSSDGMAGATRFERAKAAIRETIDGAIDGSLFTLVYVGDTTGIIFERVEDKEQAYVLLDELEPVYNTADFTDAIGIAQGYFGENPALLTYLVTDAAYETAENIEVVNVTTPVENYSLSEVIHTHVGDALTVAGKVISHGSDATVTVELYLNGEATPVATEAVDAVAGEPTPFTLTSRADAFSSIEVRIAETDALALDNRYVIYDVKSENSYNTLIVSDRPFFIESALKSQINARMDILPPAEYTGQTGYGLYIFDTVNTAGMNGLPTDGTVWLMNLAGSLEGAGFTVQGEMNLAKAEVLSPSTSSASATQTLMQGLKGNDIYVTRYIKCGFYRNFTTLMSYKGNPVIFAGTNENGNREVVFAFDIHDSNFPLLYDFSVLMRNLVNYSFPDMIETTTYTCGEAAEINVITNCESIRVESPSGGVTYLNTDRASDSVVLTEVGTYTVTMTVAGSPREFCIWSAMGAEECVPTVTHDSISLQGEPSSEGFDGRYDPLFVLFIALAVIFLADWMVYCYEKYQLR